jgi:RecA-family ATPase
VKELSLRRQKLEAATRLAQQALDFELPPGADPSGLELRTRFTVRSAADALRPQPPLEWVVEKIIPRASLSLFYDEPGAKKTYSMLSLAVCAASGRPWLGMRTRPVGVLVVDEETGEQRLSMRIAAALRGELCGAGTPLEYVCLSGLQLDDPGDVLLLQELIASRGAGLVVLDALTDLTSGDENAKQDMQPVFSRLRRLAEASGAALVLVHHANKLGSYRGSSAIKGAVDLMVQVQSEDGSDYISFKSEKNRDGEALR